MQKLINISKNLKVLYVEDNKQAREQTSKLLSNFFSYIDVAIDGRDGLVKYIEQFDKHKSYYDLVISDINMPNMDGMQMCLEILKLNHKQPILVISAHNESEKLQQLIDIGITKFVHKPIDNQVFLQKTTEIINLIHSRNVEQKRLDEIKKLNQELDALIDSFDTYVIASRTDLKGIITYASKAYETISGYSKEELIGKPHNIVRHPDMPKSAFRDLWKTIQSENLWVGEVKNLKKDGGFYWVKAFIAPYYNKDKIHIGYSAIRLDITAQKQVEELHAHVNALLNNAGEGFLSFDKNLKCESSFSKECLKIFGTNDISGLDISELLYGNDKKNRELFCEGIKRILESEDDLSRDLILSLLPKEQNINQKIIHIEYKIIESDRFMLILRDITETKKLEKKLEKQNNIQKMIVSAVSNQDEFIELKLDFEDFISNPPKEQKNLLQKLHTYKGIFAQKNMLHTVDAIHELESKIDTTKKETLTTFNEFGLKNIFNKDLNIISKAIGEEFLNKNPTIKIDEQKLDNIILEISNLNIAESQKQKFDSILSDLKKLRYISVYNTLKEYPLRVKNLAQKLEKYIYPLEIIGDKNIVLPPKYKAFMKTLIHVFNNCIDHGIEDIDTRAKNGKDEIATIKCFYKVDNKILTLNISDDGAGIDTKKLVSNAVEKGLLERENCQNMSEDEKLGLIFLSKLSTKESVSTTSGRGVGMAAVKEELDKLGGKLFIENKINKGVNFKFILPL